MTMQEARQRSVAQWQERYARVFQMGGTHIKALEEACVSAIAADRIKRYSHVFMNEDVDVKLEKNGVVEGVAEQEDIRSDSQIAREEEMARQLAEQYDRKRRAFGVADVYVSRLFEGSERNAQEIQARLTISVAEWLIG